MDRIGFSDKTFHGIRKGVASSLAENGSSIKEIAAILGHKSIRMAAYYADQASGKKLVENAVSSIVSCV
jgi:integrase